MLNAIIITVGLVICVALLSHADVRVTIRHINPQAVDKPVDNIVTQEQVDKDYEKITTPSIDQVLKDVQNIIGGDDSGD